MYEAVARNHRATKQPSRQGPIQFHRSRVQLVQPWAPGTTGHVPARPPQTGQLTPHITHNGPRSINHLHWIPKRGKLPSERGNSPTGRRLMSGLVSKVIAQSLGVTQLHGLVVMRFHLLQNRSPGEVDSQGDDLVHLSPVYTPQHPVSRPAAQTPHKVQGHQGVREHHWGI